MKIFIYAVFLAACAPPPAACECGASFSRAEAQGGSGARFYGCVAEQFPEFGSVYEEGHKVASEGQYIDSSVSQLVAGYNFNNRFSVQLNLPVIYRAYGSDAQHGTVSGVGDLCLTGSYRLYERLEEKSTFNWTVLGGVEIPTGDSSH